MRSGDKQRDIAYSCALRPENVTSIKHLKCEGLSYLVGIDKKIDCVENKGLVEDHNHYPKTYIIQHEI